MGPFLGLQRLFLLWTFGPLGQETVGPFGVRTTGSEVEGRFQNRCQDFQFAGPGDCTSSCFHLAKALGPGLESPKASKSEVLGSY